MYLAREYGDVVSGRSIFEQTQSPTNKGGSLLPLKLQLVERKELQSAPDVKKTTVLACSPPPPGGYMYSWKSTRWSSATKHHIQFTIYERLFKNRKNEKEEQQEGQDDQDDQDEGTEDVYDDYVVRYLFGSTHFTISSTRHVRYHKAGNKRSRKKVAVPSSSSLSSPYHFEEGGDGDDDDDDDGEDYDDMRHDVAESGSSEIDQGVSDDIAKKLTQELLNLSKSLTSNDALVKEYLNPLDTINRVPIHTVYPNGYNHHEGDDERSVVS